MNRRIPDVLSGLALFILLAVVVIVGARFKVLIPRSMLISLSQSPEPQKAIVAFGALISSILLILARFGIDIPVFKPVFSSEKLRQYISGLPLWVLLTTLALSIVGLVLVYPYCQAPGSVQFKIAGQDSVTFRPGDIFPAKPNDILVVSAVSSKDDDALLSCNWQYTGNAFKTLGSNTGCEINVELSSEPGDGFLTLQASQDFCPQSSLFSLQIKSKK